MGNLLMKGHGQDGFETKIRVFFLNVILGILLIVVVSIFFIWLIDSMSEYHTIGTGWPPQRVYGIRFGNWVLNTPTHYRQIIPIVATIFTVLGLGSTYLKSLPTLNSEIFLYEHGVTGKSTNSENFQLRHSEITAVSSDKAYLRINASGKEFLVYTKLRDEIAAQIRHRKEL